MGTCLASAFFQKKKIYPRFHVVVISSCRPARLFSFLLLFLSRPGQAGLRVVTPWTEFQKKKMKQSPWTESSEHSNPWLNSKKERRNSHHGLNLRKTVTLDWILEKKEETVTLDWIFGKQSSWTEFHKIKKKQPPLTESSENSHPRLNSKKRKKKQSPWTESPENS